MNEDAMNEMPEINAEETVEDTKTKSTAKKIGREIFEWAYSIVIAIIIAFLIKGFLFDIVRVDGPSMSPTLMNNDRLIVTKLGYEPKAGDIIVLDSNYTDREEYYDALANSKGKDELNTFERFIESFRLPNNYKNVYYIKRIIATEGQTVDLRDGKVYVDGEELQEPYYSGETYPTDSMTEYPFTVSEGHVFAMGDNRGNSLDSRSSQLGEVDENAIFGKSQFRFWPFSTFGKTK